MVSHFFLLGSGGECSRGKDQQLVRCGVTYVQEGHLHMHRIGGLADHLWAHLGVCLLETTSTQRS